MVKFAHLADCHLGSWRQPELEALNFESFQKAIKIILAEKVDFVLIAGDLFDSAYPSIEILKETFAEFKKLNDAQIPVYLIAGSHDFSASGKTFLDVLEKAGFCVNIENTEVQEDGSIKLKPYLHESIALYGFPGKKSGMEINDLKKVYFESVHPFTIFMAHTTIPEVAMVNMESIEKRTLPLANYYALGHIHQRKYIQEGNQHYVYPGPVFPNNFQELVDLKGGSFQITEIGDRVTTKNILIPTKEVLYLEFEIENALTATQQLIEKIDKYNLSDKVVLLKLKGTLKTGKSGDIQFGQLEEFIRKKGAYSFLRNISQLRVEYEEINLSEKDNENIEILEEAIIKEYTEKNNDSFNKYLTELIHHLAVEKNEDEKNATFEERLITEIKNSLHLKEFL